VKDAFCPTRCAQMMRDTCWDKPIFGVTYPSPVDLLVIRTDLDRLVPQLTSAAFVLRCFQYNAINCLDKDPTNKELSKVIHHHFCKTGEKPFLGNTTSTRLLYPSARLETLAPQAYKLGKMLSLLEFTLIGDSNVDQLIDWVFRYFTNISLHDLTLIKPVEQQLSGTTTHQMRARSFNETIMTNELPNRYVLVRGQSNTNNLLNEIPYEISLNYLAVFCYETNIALWPLQQTVSFLKFILRNSILSVPRTMEVTQELVISVL